jgi:hypothetical protein
METDRLPDVDRTLDDAYLLRWRLAPQLALICRVRVIPP